MAVSFVELKVSASVPANSSVRAEYVPPANEKVSLVGFVGHAAFSPNAAVCVCFDEGGASEQVIWSTKGDSNEDHLNESIPTGDNAKKIELIADNSTNEAILLTGKATLKVKV
jgi:hypothetical protein